jgi:CRISPR-associated endoribonuclease cas2
MSFRFMRVVVFFDLPTETAEERRDYRRFRAALLKNGFFMMQESVYSKIILNNTAANVIKETVRKLKTGKGLIQMLTVTERQFENMEFVLGKKQSTVVDTAERLVVL